MDYAFLLVLMHDANAFCCNSSFIGVGHRNYFLSLSFSLILVLQFHDFYTKQYSLDVVCLRFFSSLLFSFINAVPYLLSVL